MRCNVVLIGAGMIAPSYCVALRENSIGNLFGLVDINKEKANALKSSMRLEGTIVSDNIEEFLCSDKVDAFILAVPHDLHASFSKKIIKSKKHLLIEKPVVLNEDDIKVFNNKDGQIIGVAHQMRHRRLLQGINKLLQDGSLGRLINIHLDLACHRDKEYFSASGWRGDWATEGGSLVMNSGLHLIDSALWLNNGPPSRVFSQWSRHKSYIKTDDRMGGVMIFNGDVYATINMTSESSELFKPRIRLVTDRAIVEIELGFNQLVTSFAGHSDVELMLHSFEKEDRDKRCRVDCSHPAELSHLEIVDDFIAACIGQENKLVSPKEAFNTVKTIQSLYESGLSGRIVYVA